MTQADDDDEQLAGLGAMLLGTTVNRAAGGLGADLLQGRLSQAADGTRAPLLLNGAQPVSAPDDGTQGEAAAEPPGSVMTDSIRPNPSASNSSATSDSAVDELAKTVVQLYEAGKLRSGYLSKIFGSVDYANLSAGAANSTMTVGLRDIEYFEAMDGHLPQEQGSLIRWNQVDWSKYGAGQGLPPEQVMSNFLRAAGSAGN